MPPKPRIIVRPTITSASRASVVDEALRQKKVTDDKKHMIHPTTGRKSTRNETTQIKEPSTKTDSGVFPRGHTSIPPSEKPRIRAPRIIHLHDNLDFYLNKIASKPAPGYKIQDMLKWQGDYTMLERNHRYIQWLFPIPDGSGMNLYAQSLMDHEAKAMKEDDSIQSRVLSAYKMMLDFYGMRLVDTLHGTVARSNNGWRKRYEHLNRSRHNYLRITRILKSIGELGYKRFQAPWVNFLIEEAVVNCVLPNLNGGCLNHWIGAVLNMGEQEMLFRKANGLPVNRQNSINDVNSESDEEEEDNGTEECVESNIVALPLTEVHCDIPKLLEYDTKYDVGMSRLKLENIEGIAARTGSAVIGQTHGENNQENSKSHLPSNNLLFYQDQFHSRPTPGFTMQTILRYKGDRKFIEEYPWFIQWLFPIREESSTNRDSQVLYEHEAEAIKADDALSSRVLEAYEMILDCYGMKLLDSVSGKIGRNSKYKKGYEHLNWYQHNYVCITRILKSLGELGYERFQVPWIEFIVTDGIDNDLLPTLKGEYIMLWINAIRDIGERQAMFRKYQGLASRGEDDGGDDGGGDGGDEGDSDMEVGTDMYAPVDTRQYKWLSTKNIVHTCVQQ